jgi:hypothetical protein
MKKNLDTINEFIINDSQLIIQCKKNNYIVPIKNGSVIINIANELKEIIGINELHVDDRIYIFYRDIQNINEKNYIKPIKIIKLLNYSFNDETSDSENI